MTETLFPIAADDIAHTSAEFYTPRWVFAAMRLRFDLDVAAPPGGPWHVPADRYYTADDDGLAQTWDGLVWCNPPFAQVLPWVITWAAHPTGVLLCPYFPHMLATPLLVAADAVVLASIDFERSGMAMSRARVGTLVAFRGVGTAPAERLAAADPFGLVLYGPQAGGVEARRLSDRHPDPDPAYYPRPEARP